MEKKKYNKYDGRNQWPVWCLSTLSQAHSKGQEGSKYVVWKLFFLQIYHDLLFVGFHVDCVLPVLFT